jgi:hypothetical protein
MSRLVDGLSEQYGEAGAGVKLNARVGGLGQLALALSGLPGHPGYVLLRPDGSEVWRGYGQQPVGVLEDALSAVLAGSGGR